MQPTLVHYLVLSAGMLAAGIVAMLVKRNAMGVLMGMELILNAAGLNLVAFNAYLPGRHLEGQVFTLLIIGVGVAEGVLAVAIVLNCQRAGGGVTVEDQAASE